MERYMIMNVANGFMGTYILYTACELHIFDYLTDGALSSTQLSECIEIAEESVNRIVKPLVAYGFLSANDKNEYYLENSGAMLISSKEGSLHPYVLFCGREAVKVWDKLYPAVRSACSPKELVSDPYVFDKQKEDNESFRIFDGMMSTVSRNIDFNPFFTEDPIIMGPECLKIVDIGGGTGSVLFKFLHNYSKGKGVILDLPHVEDQAMENIRKEKLEDRCVFQSGDFFKPLLIDGDVFILSRVLHDWENEQAQSILKNVAGCMREQTKLLIIEELLPEFSQRGMLDVFVNDLQMWAFCGGKERTEKEYNVLLEAAGLELADCYCVEEQSFLHVLVVGKKELMEEGDI